MVKSVLPRAGNLLTSHPYGPSSSLLTRQYSIVVPYLSLLCVTLRFSYPLLISVMELLEREEMPKQPSSYISRTSWPDQERWLSLRISLRPPGSEFWGLDMSVHV